MTYSSRLVFLFLVCSMRFVTVTQAAEPHMATIHGEPFRLPYLTEIAPKLTIKDFLLDKKLVTNRDFAEFVRHHPQWQPNHKHPMSIHETSYLAHWQQDASGNKTPLADDLDKPVVFVPWFAAHAYCQAQGKRLPTTAQWEFTAQATQYAATGADLYQRQSLLLRTYNLINENPPNTVGQQIPNYWGIYDLGTLVWEWTEDYDVAILHAGIALDAVCSYGAAPIAAPSNYAAFTRNAFRAYAKPREGRKNLGFRCAAPLHGTLIPTHH